MRGTSYVVLGATALFATAVLSEHVGAGVYEIQVELLLFEGDEPDKGPVQIQTQTYTLEYVEVAEEAKREFRVKISDGKCIVQTGEKKYVSPRQEDMKSLEGRELTLTYERDAESGAWICKRNDLERENQSLWKVALFVLESPCLTTDGEMVRVTAGRKRVPTKVDKSEGREGVPRLPRVEYENVPFGVMRSCGFRLEKRVDGLAILQGKLSVEGPGVDIGDLMKWRIEVTGRLEFDETAKEYVRQRIEAVGRSVVDSHIYRTVVKVKMDRWESTGGRMQEGGAEAK